MNSGFDYFRILPAEYWEVPKNRRHFFDTIVILAVRTMSGSLSVKGLEDQMYSFTFSSILQFGGMRYVFIDTL